MESVCEACAGHHKRARSHHDTVLNGVSSASAQVQALGPSPKQRGPPRGRRCRRSECKPAGMPPNCTKANST
eukprot:9474153-Alexandrium_andersonii.AAC.1